MRTFNVSFMNVGESALDETQFDIEESDFETMFNELTELFYKFCGESKIVGVIVHIQEVPYEGEEDE